MVTTKKGIVAFLQQVGLCSAYSTAQPSFHAQQPELREPRKAARCAISSPSCLQSSEMLGPSGSFLWEVGRITFVYGMFSRHVCRGHICMEQGVIQQLTRQQEKLYCYRSCKLMPFCDTSAWKGSKTLICATPSARVGQSCEVFLPSIMPPNAPWTSSIYAEIAARLVQVFYRGQEEDDEALMAPSPD